MDLLVTAARIVLLASLGGVLAWAAHQRALVHHIRHPLPLDSHTKVTTLPCWVAAGTVAGVL